MALHTILGAGGAIANALVPLLLQGNHPVRLVSRSGRPIPGAEVTTADITDPRATLDAIKGSSTVYLLVGLPYDIQVWREQWPKIMTNVIEACKAASARLLFFDNVYMYGRVQGTMTEETPFHPVSRKGEVRARIAQQLLVEMRAGNLTALIARSADFYGPVGDRTSVLNLLVFANLLEGKKARWLCNADVPHSFTFIPDAARALYLLSQRDEAFGQTWHLPTTANPPTGHEYAALAAAALDKPDGLSVLPAWMLSLAGLFNRTLNEMAEMAYQYQEPYLFDSTRFNQAFGFSPVGYDEGIKQTAEYYR